jgi:hypothetical protein
MALSIIYLRESPADYQQGPPIKPANAIYLTAIVLAAFLESSFFGNINFKMPSS